MWFVRVIIVLYLFFYLFRWLDVKICKVKDFSYISLINLLVLGTIATYLVRRAGIGDPISVPLFFIGTATYKITIPYALSYAVFDAIFPS